MITWEVKTYECELHDFATLFFQRTRLDSLGWSSYVIPKYIGH